jgi:hypothetical protein
VMDCPSTATPMSRATRRRPAPTPRESGWLGQG